MKIKISDLGLSHSVKRPCDKKVGTPSYMSPEVYDFSGEGAFNGIKADLFSLGIILFGLNFGATPWKVPNKREDRTFSLFCADNESLFKYHEATRD